MAIHTFSGPPPGMGPMFEDGPQKPHVGLPGINFDGGPFGPPPVSYTHLTLPTNREV